MPETYKFARMPILSLKDEAPLGYEILFRNWYGISLEIFNQCPILYSELANPLLKAIYQLDRAGKCRIEGQKLFINMTILQLMSMGCLEFLTELDQSDHRLTDVVIELTEHELGHLPKALSERVLLLKRFGCQFAVDDFGRQSSNFSRVFELKPDFIKLDRSLIATAGGCSEQQRVLISLIELCHREAIQVIVEGVETQAHLDLVKACRADYVQGFHFGLPEAILNNSVNLTNS